MTPLTVRFTPDAAEVCRIEATLKERQPTINVGFFVINIVLFLYFGCANVTHTASGLVNHIDYWVGVCEIVLALMCVWAISLLLRPGRFTIAEAFVETVITLDDAGISFTEPKLPRVEWRSVSTILDIDDALLISLSAGGKVVPILKRALPGDGADLWAALDAKLTGKRYLVRGTDSRSTIGKCATKLQDADALYG